MTAIAAPPEALSPPPQSFSGPPEANPPDGQGFHGALEDSLARTATAEGHQGEEGSDASRLQSVSREGPTERRPESSAPSEPRGTEEAHGGTHGHDEAKRPAKTGQPGAEDAAGTAAGAPASTSPQHAGQSSSSSGQTAEITNGRGHAGLAVAQAPEAGTATSSRTGPTSGVGASAGTTPAASAVPTASSSPAAVAGTPEVQQAASLRQAASSPAGGTTQGQVTAKSNIPSQAASAGTQSQGTLLAEASAARSDRSDHATPVDPRARTTSGQETDTAAVSGSAASQPGMEPPKRAISTEPPLDSQAGDEAPAPTGAETTPGGTRLHLPWLDASTPNSGTTTSTGATSPSVRTTAATRDMAATNPSSTSKPSTTTAAAADGRHLGSASSTHASTSQSVVDAVQSTASSQTSTGTTDAAPPVASPGEAQQTPGVSGQAQTFTYGTNMQDTIETINATVALASRQGAAQAQISLEPAELGAVKIHLTQTSEGLVARVSAETVAGAQAIASGRNELHTTLSSLGISLLRLDVGGFSQQQSEARGQAPQAPQGSASLGGLGEEAEEPSSSTTTRTVSISSNSALIDVLA